MELLFDNFYFYLNLKDYILNEGAPIVGGRSQTFCQSFGCTESFYKHRIREGNMSSFGFFLKLYLTLENPQISCNAVKDRLSAKPPLFFY